jgi:XTP/dITP diphosphohydrolase
MTKSLLMTKTLLMATTNAGKVRELSDLLASSGFKVIKLTDLDLNLAPPPEDGLTFAENALIKAAYYAKHSNFVTIADDSGLIVEALDGRPGVHSSRYGGPDLSDRQRCLKLLSELNGRPNRRAYFESALVLSREDRHLVYSGQLHGLIAQEPRGTNGFGYDCLFVPEGFSQTLAELPKETKNSISHRFKAIENFLSDMERVMEFFT